jgi:hypothetical protein
VATPAPALSAAGQDAPVFAAARLWCQVGEVMEPLQLELALRMLRSATLEKRVLGLTDITDMTHRAGRREYIRCVESLGRGGRAAGGWAAEGVGVEVCVRWRVRLGVGVEVCMSRPALPRRTHVGGEGGWVRNSMDGADCLLCSSVLR